MSSLCLTPNARSSAATKLVAGEALALRVARDGDVITDASTARWRSCVFASPNCSTETMTEEARSSLRAVGGNESTSGKVGARGRKIQDVEHRGAGIATRVLGGFRVVGRVASSRRRAAALSGIRRRFSPAQQ